MTPPTTDTSREAVEAQKHIDSAKTAFGHQTDDPIALLALRVSQLDRLAKERLLVSNSSTARARKIEIERDNLRQQVEELTASEEGAMAIIAAERAEVMSLRKQLAEERAKSEGRLQALVSEQDMQSALITQARNEALEEAAALFDEEAAHDWGGIEYSSLVGVPISNAEDLRKSAKLAERNAADIRALKSAPAPREVTPQDALDADKILAAANTAIQGYVDGRDSYARGVQAGISRMSEALRALAQEGQSDG